MTDHLTIKPHFCWKVFMRQGLYRRSFLALWFSFFLAMVYGAASGKGLLPIPLFVSAAICIPAMFFSSLAFGKNAYAETEYRILPTKVEIQSGWFVRQTRIVRFSDIDHILLEQSALQRQYGIGSLALVPKPMPVASAGWAQKDVRDAFIASAPRLRDVPNPGGLFELLNDRRAQALD